VCETVVDAIEAHRAVTASVGPEALAAMAPGAKEQAMRSKLLAAQALHPALVLPDGHYRVRSFLRANKV